MFVQLMKVKIATKSRFGRKHSVDFNAEKFQDGLEDLIVHSVIDAGVSTSTSLQSYAAPCEEQRKEHMAATRIQSAFRAFLVSILALLSPIICCVVIFYSLWPLTGLDDAFLRLQGLYER